MSYHIYTTRGLVLSARPVREADRVYSVLTRDFGLIRALAGGVRKIASKMRGNLEPMSFSDVSLVRGKEYWRVTGSSFRFNAAEVLENRREAVKTFARIMSLVEKLVAGEENHPAIYDILESFAESVKHSVFDNYKELEIAMLARILYELGYIQKEEMDKLSDVAKNRKELIRAINNGIKESGLIL